MSDSELRKARRAVYAYYHQDGISDLILATTILWFALLIQTDEVYGIGGILACWLIMYFPLKEAITLPRIGFVRLRSTANNIMLIVLAGFALLGVVFLLGTSLGWIPWDVFRVPAENIYLTVGAVLAIAILVVAVAYGARRFYLYALLCIIGLPVAGMLEISLALITAVLGTIILIASLIILRSFLRQHPVRQPLVVEDGG